MVSDDDGRDDGVVSFSWPLSYKGDRPRPRLPGGKARRLVFWISPLSVLSPGVPAPEESPNHRDGNVTNVLTPHSPCQHLKVTVCPLYNFSVSQDNSRNHLVLETAASAVCRQVGLCYLSAARQFCSMPPCSPGGRTAGQA